MRPLEELAGRLAHLRLVFLAVGAVAAALCVWGARYEPATFYPGYLVAFLFWLGIALGSWAIVMIHNLTGGSWGLAIRRVLEAAMGTLPILALLYIPLCFGWEHLYSWMHPSSHGAHHAVLQAKSGYLNVEFFRVRAIVYFGVWLLVPWALAWLSSARTVDSDRARRRPSQLISGPGLLLYGVTVTFASIDWSMSIEPEWYSSMYGVIFMAGQAVSGLSFAIVVTALTAGFAPWQGTLSRDRWHDLGNLLLAMVMFWAYVALMQYIIIWSGNLPEETPWYIRRSTGGWQVLVYLLVAGHFLAPFFLLLIRDVKRYARRLAAVAAVLLAMRMADLYWLVMPPFYAHGFGIHWLHLASACAIGGLWLATFSWLLVRRARLPSFEDPVTNEAPEELGDERARYASS